MSLSDMLRRQADHRATIAAERAKALEMARRPGIRLQEQGVDEPPSPIRDDAISRAARRLIDFHYGSVVTDDRRFSEYVLVEPDEVAS